MARSRLKALAWANVILHVIGLAALLGGIRPGSSPLVPLADRLQYLASARWGWTLGWVVWMLCGLVLVAFFLEAARRLRGPNLGARVAVCLVVVAGLVDLTSDFGQAFRLPRLAASDEATFLAAERAYTFGGVVIANGLYSLGTLVLTLSLRRSSVHSRAALALGLGVFAAGMLLSLAGIVSSFPLLVLATAATFPLYMLWTITLAQAIDG